MENEDCNVYVGDELNVLIENQPVIRSGVKVKIQFGLYSMELKLINN